MQIATELAAAERGVHAKAETHFADVNAAVSASVCIVDVCRGLTVCWD